MNIKNNIKTSFLSFLFNIYAIKKLGNTKLSTNQLEVNIFIPFQLNFYPINAPHEPRYDMEIRRPSSAIFDNIRANVRSVLNCLFILNFIYYFTRVVCAKGYLLFDRYCVK